MLEGIFILKKLLRLREQTLAVKAQARFICADKGHNGRLVNFENAYSHR